MMTALAIGSDVDFQIDTRAEFACKTINLQLTAPDDIKAQTTTLVFTSESR